MKRIIFIILVLIVSFSLGQGIVPTIKQYNMEMKVSLQAIDELIYRHQVGVFNVWTFPGGTQDTLSATATNAQKQVYIAAAITEYQNIKAKCDLALGLLQ